MLATEGKFGSRCASLRAPMTRAMTAATGIRADSVVAAAEPNLELVAEPNAELVAEPVAEPVVDGVVEPVVKRMPRGLHQAEQDEHTPGGGTEGGSSGGSSAGRLCGPVPASAPRREHGVGRDGRGARRGARRGATLDVLLRDEHGG